MQVYTVHQSDAEIKPPRWSLCMRGIMQTQLTGCYWVPQYVDLAASLAGHLIAAALTKPSSQPGRVSSPHSAAQSLLPPHPGNSPTSDALIVCLRPARLNFVLPPHQAPSVTPCWSKEHDCKSLLQSRSEILNTA